jgi:hypothetical protein
MTQFDTSSEATYGRLPKKVLFFGEMPLLWLIQNGTF